MNEKVKLKWILSSSMVVGLFASSTSKIYGALGDNAQQFANTAQNELLGLAEVVGLIGILGCGTLFAVGQRDVAKKCIIGVLVGYFVIKYAQPIWNMIMGGI